MGTFWKATLRRGAVLRTSGIMLFTLGGCSSTDGDHSGIDGGSDGGTALGVDAGGADHGPAAASGDSATGLDGDASATPADTGGASADTGALDGSEAGQGAETGAISCVPTTPTCCAPSQAATVVTDLCSRAGAPVGQGTSLPVSGTFFLVQRVTYVGNVSGCLSFPMGDTDQTTLQIQGADWSVVNDAVIAQSTTSGHAGYTVLASGSTLDITKVCASGRDLILPVTSDGPVTYDFTDPVLALYSATDGYFFMRQ